jgi:hypothetical protein
MNKTKKIASFFSSREKKGHRTPEAATLALAYRRNV